MTESKERVVTVCNDKLCLKEEEEEELVAFHDLSALQQQQQKKHAGQKVGRSDTHTKPTNRPKKIDPSNSSSENDMLQKLEYVFFVPSSLFSFPF